MNHHYWHGPAVSRKLVGANDKITNDTWGSAQSPWAFISDQCMEVASRIIDSYTTRKWTASSIGNTNFNRLWHSAIGESEILRLTRVIEIFKSAWVSEIFEISANHWDSEIVSNFWDSEIGVSLRFWDWPPVIEVWRSARVVEILKSVRDSETVANFWDRR